MVQARHGPRFATEPLPQITPIGQRPRQNLIAPMRSTRVSRARYTSPIPPAPIAERISYGPGVGQAKGHLTSLDFAKYNTEISVSVAIGCL